MVDQGTLPTVRGPSREGHDLDAVLGPGEPTRAFEPDADGERYSEHNPGSLGKVPVDPAPCEAPEAPMPPLGSPELALALAGVPDSLAQTGGDLYAVIINVAVNAWVAGHIPGEDGCAGRDSSRGNVGHDWQARMRTITEMQPNITKWFDRDVWTAAVNDSGFTVTRR
ncbi:hypothetical protein ACFRCI_50030 [Streptomyces sp. NPDC056638]|uniref:hypothetical protein n=1 Tax=Streptomyces sp. NPDC056638 TaxID=3345887 RepID=UPI00369A2D3C